MNSLYLTDCANYMAEWFLLTKFLTDEELDEYINDDLDTGADDGGVVAIE